ncbi:MAG: sugar phosphate isomerase/epimerase family protein [Phycisphaeraceae bacterium]
MTEPRIGAQMFTLREFCQAPADIAKTFARLRKIGFTAVQPSAAGFNDIPAEELKKLLDDHGLICAATHRPLDEIRDVERVADYHKTLGCEFTAIGGFGFGGKPRAEWEAFAREYSLLGQQCDRRGLRLGYHHHSHELAPFAEDPAEIDPLENPMWLLARQLDESVWFEIDTYWIAHGGADPAAWLRRLKGRAPAIHVKDMTVTADREHKMCEVGRGNLNWPAILAAAKDAGVKWYLIERDRGDLDPFDSLQISLENLQQMLAE